MCWLSVWWDRWCAGDGSRADRSRTGQGVGPWARQRSRCTWDGRKEPARGSLRCSADVIQPCCEDCWGNRVSESSRRWRFSVETASRCVKTRRWWPSPRLLHFQRTGWRRRTGKSQEQAGTSAPWVYRPLKARQCESFWISPLGPLFASFSPLRLLMKKKSVPRFHLSKVMFWSGVWERSSVWHLIPVRWRRLVQPSDWGLSQALRLTQQRLSALITVKLNWLRYCFHKILLLQENDVRKSFWPAATGCFLWIQYRIHWRVLLRRPIHHEFMQFWDWLRGFTKTCILLK